jgi:hypothetical protein
MFAPLKWWWENSRPGSAHPAAPFIFFLGVIVMGVTVGPPLLWLTGLWMRYWLR